MSIRKYVFCLLLRDYILKIIQRERNISLYIRNPTLHDALTSPFNWDICLQLIFRVIVLIQFLLHPCTLKVMYYACAQQDGSYLLLLLLPRGMFMSIMFHVTFPQSICKYICYGLNSRYTCKNSCCYHLAIILSVAMAQISHHNATK